MNEAKTCAECGKPLPQGCIRITCSDECWRERSRRLNREWSARYRAKKKLEIKDAGLEKQRRVGYPGSEGKRQCAGGCGRWINDYRCKACWARLRARNGLPAEVEDDGMEECSLWR